jgi:hypothetical protein
MVDKRQMLRGTIFLTFIALLLMVVPCEATLYAFWATAEKDGYVQKTVLPDNECPFDHTAQAISTGIIGSFQSSYKGYFGAHVWDRAFFSFDTASLEGEAIDSAEVKIVVNYKEAANWEATLLIDFVRDCISWPLAVADTSCYVSADTTIPYTALPAVGDTLTIVMRPTWVNSTGATEIVMKSEKEADVCAATGNNVVKFRTTEYDGTTSDPRLYVWAHAAESRSTPTKLRPRTSALQQVPDNWLYRLEFLRQPARGAATLSFMASPNLVLR